MFHSLRLTPTDASIRAREGHASSLVQRRQKASFSIFGQILTGYFTVIQSLRSLGRFTSSHLKTSKTVFWENRHVLSTFSPKSESLFCATSTCLICWRF